MQRILSFVLSLLLLCVATATPAQAGFLYVMRADAAGNQIYGFSVDEATGALTALASFPVTTGGTGNDGTDSEQLTIDRANNRLYASNRGSQTISAYSINSATGALTALPFSPIALGNNGGVTIAVHPTGSPLVVSNFSVGTVKSYAITATTATEAAGSPYSTGIALPFSSVFSRDGNSFYTGGNGGSLTFAGFSADSTNGVLTPLAGSPFNSGGTNPVAYAMDAQGRLFMASIGAGQLRVFQTTAGIPAAATGNPFVSGLSAAIDGVLHPNGNFYFVADRTGNRVGSYQISGADTATTLAAVAGSPFPSGGVFTDALVTNQTGAFLYAANGNSRNLTTYSVNPTTGVLTNIAVQSADTLGTTGRMTGIDYLAAVPTSTSVTVGGRVLTAQGRGVSGATVFLTDMTGETRRTRANPFGYYRFTDVQSGETYIIEARHKRYQFAPQAVSVIEELTELNFVALP